MQQLDHLKRNAKIARQCCLLLLTAACGSKAVNLDSAALVASSDPTVVGTVREQVGQLAVDDERLYWTGSPTRSGQDIFGGGALRSCLKENCAATVVTYDGDAVVEGSAFGLYGGEIFWFQYQTATTALVASPIAGGTSRTVATLDLPRLAAFDGDHVYLSAGDNQVYFLTLSGVGQVPRLIGTADALKVISTIAAGMGYMYWLAGGIDTYDGPRAAAASLQGVRADGSSSVETLATGLEFNPGGGLTLDATYVYWAQDVLAGSIRRCPLTGCTGEPEAVATSIRSPTSLLLDGQNLYFQHEIAAYQYALSTCALGQCAAPSLVANGLDSNAGMAIDDQYLYVVTTDQDLEPPADENPVAQIRRFAK